MFEQQHNKHRQIFIQRLGLLHDPFQTPVAEQELARVRGAFYSYYSPTPFSLFTEGGSKNLLVLLREEKHVFIYGPPGSGKSTLRLTFEAECRTVLDGTLAVNYTLGENVDAPFNAEEHGQRLARTMAIDLVLAIIEQFNPVLPFPSSEQIELLSQQIQIGGRALKRLLHILLEKDESEMLDSTWGLSAEWKNIGKAPVKYVPATKELKTLLRIMQATTKANIKRATGWDLFEQALRTAQMWGFNRFFILVDGVDAKQREPKDMMALIEPLLELIGQIEHRKLFFKFFLPPDLKTEVEKLFSSKNLHFIPYLSIMIEWNDEALRQVLRQRFLSASPRSGLVYTGLNSLATPDFDLERHLIKQAKGSPRRLLNLVNDLIDIHVMRDPGSFRFTEEDWEALKTAMDAEYLG